MRKYSRYIPLIGGLLAFFSFALPWVGVYKGIGLVIGGFHPISVILIILLGLIGFGISVMRFVSKSAGIILIAFGLFFFLVLLSVFFQEVNDVDRGSSFITIAFFMSLIIIGSSLMLNRQGDWHSFARVFVFIYAGIGLLCFLIVVFSLKLGLEIEGTLNPKIKYGAFLTAIGYILSIAGVLEMPQRLENPITKNEENQSNS